MLEIEEGDIEVIGIMFGAIHTVETVNSILGETVASMTIADVEDAIHVIPSPETIINVAIPLILNMRSPSISAALIEFLEY